MSDKQLVRVNQNRMLFGVASGVAQYFNVDPTIVRVLFVVFTLMTSVAPGIVAYLILLLLMPEDSYMAENDSFDPDDIVIKDLD